MSDDPYQLLIIKSIRKNQVFGINDVCVVEIVATMQSYHDHIEEIAAILEAGLYSELSEVVSGPRTIDDLTVIKFKNGDQQEFYGIVYDSDELWQDPVVTRVSPGQRTY